MRPRPARRGFLLASAATLLAVLQVRFDLLSRLATSLDPVTLQAWLENKGPAAPLLYVLLMAAVVVSPLPTVPLDFAAGRLFGPAAGTLYSAAGATLGSLVSFYAARWLGRDFVSRFLKGHIHFCPQCSDRLLTKIVFVGRLLPLAPFDLLSYGAGLTRMSAPRFAAASFLGMLPLTFVYNSAGDIVLGHPWLGWAGGVLFVVLLFGLPLAIERFDLFSMRRYFQHSPVAVGETTEP
jgi:uncharacterized membrane protein YdjX (TVP38/TMEM64 family)